MSDFQRPNQDARDRLWIASRGSGVLFVLGVLGVGFGVALLTRLADWAKANHPTLAAFVFGSSFGMFVTFVICVLAACGTAAAVGWLADRVRAQARQGGRIRDDRGRPVGIVTPGWRAVAPFLRPRGDAAARARAALALPPEFVWRLRGAIVLCCACVWFSALSIRHAVLAGTAFTRWYTWSPLLQASMISFNVWLIWRSARRHDEQVVSGLLRAAMCPACGYDLSAIPPEADGCSVCPECGAAWKRAAGRASQS